MRVPPENILIPFGQNGHAEIRHEKEKTTSGGPLLSVTVTRDHLLLMFAWRKKSTIPPTVWVDDPDLKYEMNIAHADIFSIRSGRIAVYLREKRRLIVFFPQDMSASHPALRPQFPIS